MRPYKIAAYGLTEEVLKMQAAGKTNVEIAKRLSAPGRSFSVMAVKRFVDAHESELREAQALALSAKRELGERKVTESLDTVAQLRYINNEMQALLREAREAGDGELAVKATLRIEKQLELQARLLGDLTQPRTVVFNVTQVIQHQERKEEDGRRGDIITIEP